MSKFFHALLTAVLVFASALTTSAAADPAANFIVALGNPQPYVPMLNGSGPIGTLLKGPGGTLWGVTWRGGTHDVGVIFCLTPPSPAVPRWTETVVHTFTGGNTNVNDPTGANPLSGLVPGPGGRFYGTTSRGGVGGYWYAPWGGTVYSIDPTTTNDTYRDETHLPPGFAPYGPPIFSGGYVFGTFTGLSNLGGIYRSTLGGNFDVSTHVSPTTYYSTGTQDGGFWPVGGLIAGPNGIFYGTMTRGGDPGTADRAGVVFSISHTLRAATYRVLHTFDSPNDGSSPVGTLIRDSASNLYGVTRSGGPGGPGGRGTVYRLSPKGGDWTFTRLATFAVSLDHGQSPVGVSLDRTGRLFGSTADGVVFSLTRPSADTGQEWSFNRILQIPGIGVDLGNYGYNFAADNNGVPTQAPDGALVHDFAGRLYVVRSYQNAVVQITGAGFAR